MNSVSVGVYIPSLDSEKTENEHFAETSEHQTYSKTKVLLADDHRLVREGLARMLGQEPDIEIVGQAADGINAVELARKLAPDVILMDLSMPKMGGIEATRIIHRELPQIKIIGVSMHEEAANVEELMGSGAVAYLTKNGLSAEILSTIRASVNKRELRTQVSIGTAGELSFTTIHDPRVCSTCRSLLKTGRVASEEILLP